MSNFDILQSSEYRDELATQKAFMVKVYGWMTAGLLITATMALLVAGVPAARQFVFGNPGVAIGLIIAEVVVAFGMIAAMRVMPAALFSGLFLLYSTLTGISLSAVLLVYTRESVATTFFVTAGMFGSMTAYGYLTKRDLTSWGTFLIMGLWGLILASIVNQFMGSSMMGFVISCAGVLIFTGLTAYDTQKISQAYAAGGVGSDEQKKTAIWGALMLYLDFVNLFLYLLRFLGDRRN